MVTGDRLSAYRFSDGGESPPTVLAVRDFSWLKRWGLASVDSFVFSHLKIYLFCRLSTVSLLTEAGLDCWWGWRKMKATCYASMTWDCQGWSKLW